MRKVFLSYSSERREWIEAFRRTSLLEDHLRPAEIFDYAVSATLQGRYREVIRRDIEGSNIFIAIVHGSYKNSGDCLFEFDTAYPLFFHDGKPRRAKAFGIIFLDKEGPEWFAARRADSRSRFPDDFAYLELYDHHGAKYPFTDSGSPNSVWNQLRRFLEHVRKNSEPAGERAPSDPVGGGMAYGPSASSPTVVLVGYPRGPAPAEIAADFEALKSFFKEENSLQLLPDGWRTRDWRTIRGNQEFLSELATRKATFVMPVDSEFADDAIDTPTMLADWLKGTSGASEEGPQGTRAFDAASLVYWRPPGVVDDGRFSKQVNNQALKVGPQFRAGSAKDIFDWLTPLHPAPPIKYEAAPLDRAVQQLASKLRDGLDGKCRPPEPTALPFIPNEKPLREALADMAEARAGIFITHAVDVEALSDEIPEDLMQKALSYVDQLEKFCSENGLKIDQIYRVALVRQRKSFWKGPWTIDVGKQDQNQRLLGWRFLGIRRGEAGGFEMDEQRIDQIVSDVRTLIQS